MERKVGEIFEYNGEWYQCMHVPQKHSCKLCDLRGLCCDNNGVKIVTCVWRHREDNTSVIFKKLKKVGEPEIINGKKVQSIVTGYVGCAFCIFKKGGACLSGGTCKNRGTGTIYVEVKQNKENMEESVELKLFADRTSNVNEVYMEKRLCNRLKPFNLEAAKAGKPVCTRDGRKARIICFDAKCNKPIVALIYDCNKETVLQYLENGRFFVDQIDKYDLMMFPQKKEGWVNVYKSYNVGKKIPCMASIYPTKEEAKKSSVVGFDYVDTVKIEWEE